jgi:hypothetical protein
MRRYGSVRRCPWAYHWIRTNITTRFHTGLQNGRVQKRVTHECECRELPTFSSITEMQVPDIRCIRLFPILPVLPTRHYAPVLTDNFRNNISSRRISREAWNVARTRTLGLWDRTMESISSILPLRCILHLPLGEAYSTKCQMDAVSGSDMNHHLRSRCFIPQFAVTELLNSGLPSENGGREQELSKHSVAEVS